VDRAPAPTRALPTRPGASRALSRVRLKCPERRGLPLVLGDPDRGLGDRFQPSQAANLPPVVSVTDRPIWNQTTHSPEAELSRQSGGNVGAERVREREPVLVYLLELLAGPVGNAVACPGAGDASWAAWLGRWR
jgi:hypothetical protein